MPSPGILASDSRPIVRRRPGKTWYARPNETIAPGATDPMPVHVDDLVALLHALGASPAHLVGN